MVFAVGDPVAAGFAASLAKPGGNGNRLSAVTTELAPSGLSAKQLVPRAQRIASLFNPTNPLARRGPESPQNLGVEIVNLEARNAEELDAALPRCHIAQLTGY